MATEFVFQLQVTGPDGEQTIKLEPGQTAVIGRRADNTIYLAHSLVSRQHAQIECTAEGCTITDLDSANGTVVNHEVITPQAPQPLPHNAQIDIGPYQILYQLVPLAATDEPEAAAVVEAVADGPVVDSDAGVLMEPAGEYEQSGPVPEPRIPSETPPRVPPAPPPLAPAAVRPLDDPFIPPGLSQYSVRLLDYLPGIYHTNFMSRFLALFEAVLIPIEWNVDNFDLYLSPGTAPQAFLPWLSSWFNLTFDDTWSEAQRRTLMAEAHQLYARLGTRWALARVLEIYTGQPPEITDLGDDLEPFTFVVKMPLRRSQVAEELIENLIDAYKPAHTSYRLQYID